MGESSAAVRDAIGRLLGDMAVVLEPPELMAGSRVSMRIEPRDAEALATALRTLDSGSTPAIITGGGSRLGLGNPVRGAQVELSCVGLVGIDELDAADGVIRVGAGTPLAEIERAVRPHGWQLPLDPPGQGTTVGGTLASAAAGPRRLGFGAARDCVLGLDTVLACGDRTRCGGRVVKNVTGYDLAKLYVGSLGTLGVIERAWLRLRPAPRSTRVVVLSLGPDPDPYTFALAAARHSAARAVALVCSELADTHMQGVGHPLDAADWLLVAEYAGDEEATGEGAERLAEGRAASPGDLTAIDALRDLQGSVGALGVRARLHVRPSRLAASCALLRAAAAQLLVYPQPGVIYAFFDPSGGGEEDPWWLDGVFTALERVRGEAKAELVVEELPEWGRGRRDVFFGGSGPLSLMRRIKARFDPNGTLNPGRFVGSI
jgi:glycolate oxidase FAD binding subunit